MLTWRGFTIWPARFWPTAALMRKLRKTLIDRWMLSRLQRRIAEATEAMENIQTRRALQSAFYLLFNDLRWYQRRGGKNQLRAVLSRPGCA